MSLEELLRLFGSDSSEFNVCADEAKADSHSTDKYCINLLHLPANDIAAAVKSNRAQAVALSINQFKDEKKVVKEIEELKTSLNTGINILICTNGKPSMDYLAKIDGISVTKLKNFRQKLESLTWADSKYERIFRRNF